jgi:hypothetical protein
VHTVGKTKVVVAVAVEVGLGVVEKKEERIQP